jgi:hypothetical protein
MSDREKLCACACIIELACALFRAVHHWFPPNPCMGCEWERFYALKPVARMALFLVRLFQRVRMHNGE